MEKKYKPPKLKKKKGGARLGAGRKPKPKDENEQPKIKKPRGGFKFNAGRKSMFLEGVETKSISFTIPLDLEQAVRMAVHNAIKSLLYNAKND